MKAVVLEEFKSSFVIKEIDKPIPKKSEVLVKIAASGINPLDIKIKRGEAAHAQTKLPAVLGIDMVGTITAIGDDVEDFSIGDEVYGMTGGIAGVQGSLAEYVAADVALLAKKPSNLNVHNSAAVPLIFITAWEGLVDRAKVAPGMNVLIHGGAGGVGHMAIQIAKAKGANVFTTVTPNMNDLIQCYGATPIDYTSLSVKEYVEKYTNGEGFDIVFDTVGGAVLDASFHAAKQYYGHVISILGWGTHHLAPLSFKGATYSGVFTLYPLIFGKGRAHHGKILREATQLIEAGKLIPNVDPKVFHPGTIEDAYQYLESKFNKGKVVVDIAF